MIVALATVGMLVVVVVVMVRSLFARVRMRRGRRSRGLVAAVAYQLWEKLWPAAGQFHLGFLGRLVLPGPVRLWWRRRRVVWGWKGAPVLVLAGK
jgi:hypothetical protein